MLVRTEALLHAASEFAIIELRPIQSIESHLLILVVTILLSFLIRFGLFRSSLLGPCLRFATHFN